MPEIDAQIRDARELTKEEKAELLKLKRSDITSKFLKDWFAVRPGQSEPRFEGNFTLTLLPGESPFYIKTATKTTIGRYIANLVFIPDKYIKKFGYVNFPLDTGGIGKIQSNLGLMLLDDELTVKEYIEYLDRGEWLGMNTAFFMLPSMNYKVNKPIDSVIKLRDELFDKYKKEIAEGDSNTADMIEKKVLGAAKEELISSKNPSYDYYASGEFKFANNYKKTSIMGGAVVDLMTNKLVITKGNYMDGISKEEYPIFTGLTVGGGYGRGVATQEGGYETKKLNLSLQSASIDEEDSDCGTELTANILLTDKNYKMFKERYIVENNRLVLLTGDNIKNYIGKVIHLRSPLYCKNPKYCRKCSGEILTKLDINNAGLLTSTYSGTLMNMSMKKIHDASVKFTKIDFTKFIQER